MAKDPNNSDNDNEPNQIGDFGLSRLAEIAAESRPSAEERELRRKAKIARKGIDIYESLNEVARKYEPIQKLQKRNINTISRTEPRIRTAVEARQQRLTAQAVNTISREFSESSLSGTISELAASPEAQQGALSMMSTPYIDLVGEQRARMARLNQLGEANRAMASKVIGRQGLNQDVYGNIQANTKEAQAIIGELGTINAALGQQRAQGLDPKSRNVAMMTDVSRARGIPESDKAYESAQQLIKAFEQLSKVTDVTSDEFKNLQKTTDDARKEFAAASGGGGRSGRDAFMSYANIAQSGFGAAAGAIQQIGVNQRLAQAQNAAGYAEFENQKYQAYKAAAGGDIASLMQLSQFAGAEDFGGQLRTAANVAVGAQVAGGIAQTAAGVVDIASTINPAENALSTSAAQANRERGIINTMEGAATTAVGTADLARGVSGGQADLAARQARMRVSQAINAVGAEQMQGFRDFSVGLGTATIGMGSRGEDFLRRSIDDKNLSRMANARISPEQYAQMAQMGTAAMGSMFNENQIFAARGAEARGLGTMQENMQRMAALSGAGANNPQTSLASVMEVALARGLDSSKALNAVVDHTASMAASSAGRALGLDTTAAAAALLTSTVNKDAPNKEAALERAASIQDKIRDIGTNQDVSFAGMVATARIQKTTGMGGVSSLLAQGLDTQTLMAMQGLSPEKQRDALIKQGIDVRGKDPNKVIGTLLEDRQMTLLEAKGSGFAVNYDKNAVLKAVRSGKGFDDLSEAEKIGVSQAAGLQKMTGPELIAAVSGVGAKINPNAPKGTEALTMPAADDKSLRASMDKMRTMGFEQLTTAAQTAASNLGGAATAIKTLTTAFEGLEKAMPSIEKGATTAAGRAAAGERGLNVDKFNLAIDKLSDVLDRALKKSSLGPAYSDNKQRMAPPGP